MIIEELDVKILDKANNPQNGDDIKDVITALIDHNIILTKTLNYLLENLTSDNITEIDFGRTTTYNLSTLNTNLAKVLNDGDILLGLATQKWVTDNFTPKP